MSFDAMGDDRFRVLVEASPAAVIATSREGVVEFANAETERMFGYRREELIGKSVETLVPACMRKSHASFPQGFLADPSRRPMGAGRDLEAVRRDGSEFPVEIGLTPIETATGMMIMATVLDITVRRETEKALAARAAELEHVNERLAQFAYVASLDLQGPLKKILAFSELLENAIARSDQAEMTYSSQVMRASALHARKLVDDLLTYSSTIYGEQQLEILDLREEVQFTLADLSEAIAETSTEISVELPETAFIADRSQFSRLMQNIVTNAIKYRKPGRTAKIEIVAAPVDSAVRLAIIDNGVGFEEEFAQTIFEPFAHHGKVQYPGTGIELAICKSIADRHGWRIAVRSHPGEGATFFFTIPTLFTIPAVEQG